MLCFQKCAKSVAWMLVSLSLIMTSAIRAADETTEKADDADKEVVENPLEQSKKLKADLEVWPERVRKQLAAIEAKLQGMDLKQVRAERMLADDFAEVLGRLDDEAQLIEESYAGITPILGRWREAVEKSPLVFRALGAAFDEKAAESDEKDLKTHYADFASAARTLAGKYDQKAKTLATLETDLQRKLQYVGKSRKFIGDVRQFLAAIPASEEAIEVERFAKRLNAYIAVFNDAVKSLKDLSHEVGSERQAPPSPGSRPGSTSRPQTNRRPVAADYQTLVASLRTAK
ncbi:MAG: hypothetical protein ACKV0T_17620 [Planctomycetales bacterium]